MSNVRVNTKPVRNPAVIRNVPTPLTRAAKGQCVIFRDAAGHKRQGVVLVLRSDHALIGHQDPTRPYVWVGEGDSARRVANNSLWTVPYADILETVMRQAA